MTASKQRNYAQLSASEVLDELGSGPQGLSQAIAAQRLSDFGPNTQPQPKRHSLAASVALQLKNPVIIILLVSAGLALSLRDEPLAAIFFGIAFVNLGVGAAQEHHTEAFDQPNRSNQSFTTVVRGGEPQQISSHELVIGDIVQLQAGDTIAADMRLIKTVLLSTDDSPFSHQHNPVQKFSHSVHENLAVYQRHNIVFAGTVVASGSATAVVVACGAHTEFGRGVLAHQAESAPRSPLQQTLHRLNRQLLQVTAIISGLLAIISLQSNFSLHTVALFGVSIGAALAPNGLLAAVGLTLAHAAGRLARSGVIVKRLSAVETLGAVNIILADKTGSLTANEPVAQHLLIGRTSYGVTGNHGFEPVGEIVSENGKPLSTTKLRELHLFFACAALASKARINPPDTEHKAWHAIGDTTDGALLTLLRKAGLDADELEADYPELHSFAFDADRKLMSSLRTRNGDTIVFAKGAPEAILAASTDLWDHGHVRNLAPADHKYYADYTQRQAAAGYRNIALAFSVIPAGKQPEHPKDIEHSLTLLGVVSLADPLRSGVAATMRAARLAHVHVALITGDAPATALAIARQADLAPTIHVITGSELAALTDNRVLELIENNGAVFCRVNPEDKLRIVQIARRSGRIVAVTGDGLSDSAALQHAHVGITMAASTGVAKQAADITLTSPRFSSLMRAVEQGRLTYHNLHHIARCVLTDNTAELLLVLIAVLAAAVMHVVPAITAIQILAIDLIAQIIPLVALSWDPAPTGLMRMPPRNRRQHLLDMRSIVGLVGFGLLAAGLSYANYLWFFARHHLDPRYLESTLPLYHQATSLTFVTLSICLCLYLLFERADSQPHFFTRSLIGNQPLLIAFGISLTLTLIAVYLPLAQSIFGTTSLSLIDWITAILAASLFAGGCLLQRYTRQHSRGAVLELHRTVR